MPSPLATPEPIGVELCLRIPSQGEVRRLMPDECEGVMAFPAGWTIVPGVSDSEETDTARYHALGNAVTPPVIEWLAARLRARLEECDEETEEPARCAIAV